MIYNGYKKRGVNVRLSYIADCAKVPPIITYQMTSSGFNRPTVKGSQVSIIRSPTNGRSIRLELKNVRMNMEDVPPMIRKAAANPTLATPQRAEEYLTDYSDWETNGWGYGTSADLHKSMPKDPQALPDIDLSAIDMELNPDKN